MRFGDRRSQEGRSVAVDRDGNIVLTGRAMGALDFGDGPLSAGDADWTAFLVKFDPTGKLLWAKRFGERGSVYGNAVAVDALGNILLTGELDGVVDFGAGPVESLAPSADVFVAKFDASGRPLWSHLFGDEYRQSGRAIAVDAAGDVVVAGEFEGTIDFGGGPFTGAGNVFLAKFDAEGRPLWSKGFQGINPQHTRDVVVDRAGRVVIAGDFYEGMVIDGERIRGRGQSDAFLASFDADGHLLWNKSFGGPGYQDAPGLALGPGDDLFLAGWFEHVIDFGGTPIESRGLSDIYMARFDASGALLHARRFDADGRGGAPSVAVSREGRLVLTGWIEGDVDFDGTRLAKRSAFADVYVAVLDSWGETLRAARYGDDEVQVSNSIAMRSDGRALITGAFSGSIDFGGGALESAGMSDIFLVELAP